MIAWPGAIQIGVGDGVTTAFQLTDLGGFAIAMPSAGSVSVAGTTPSYTVSSTGLVTFSQAPAAGAAITLIAGPGYVDRMWIAQNATRTMKPALWTAKFGDGYLQTMPQGMNYLPESWSLEFFFAQRSDADALHAYLLAQGGYQAFTWRTPRASILRVLCQKWSDVSNVGKQFTLSATFDQVWGM